MVEFYSEINADLRKFIEAQEIFFIASAPPDSNGRVNVSPKGYSSFSVIDSRTAAYIDYPGSGNETAEHISKGGRVTVMFCSFDKKPRVLRLYCRGKLLPLDKGRDVLPASMLEAHPFARQIILLHILEVMTSCGYGVPYFKYLGEREALKEWSKKII